MIAQVKDNSFISILIGIILIFIGIFLFFIERRYNKRSRGFVSNKIGDTAYLVEAKTVKK